MLTTGRRHNSLSLSGGHIVSDKLTLPSYSPNAVSAPQQSFPWDDSIDDINTPDIDPSFFDNDPFKKYNTSMMDMPSMDMYAEESTQQLIHSSLEDNLDLSALISQTVGDSQQIVSPNEVLENQYIPSTTAPVLHYLQPRPVESIADMTCTVNLDVIADNTSHSLTHLSSPSHSTVSYLSSPSPALSYTSSTASHAFTSDTNATIDTIEGVLEFKPEPAFLQPTVIDDHLYTLPSTSKSGTKRRRSSEKGAQRQKNNVASKKSRVSKRDKQKLMEEQIQHYVTDNAKCKKMIDQMEREIQWCKDYLFKKVVSTARS